MAHGRSLRLLAAGAVALVAGCTALGSILDQLGTERPPLPLRRAMISSDARLDSTGAIAGSFVGEGTSRRVHLLSSDTVLVSDLVRRYRPARDRRLEPLEWLRKQGRFSVDFTPRSDSAILDQTALAGSPAGHTRVRPRTLHLEPPACRGGAPRAELVVEPEARNGPSLRGPVVGSFRAPGDWWPVRDTEHRTAPEPPPPDLVDSLIERTDEALDSLLARRLPARDLPLTRTGPARIMVNTLDDEDAADVLAFRLDDGRVRYAVSLRTSRRTARGARVLAAGVLIWDRSLAWQQLVFEPTLLEYGRRGRGPVGAAGDRTEPLFWRRLDALSGFAFRRDYLWLEQVDVESGQVLWVILEPKSNTIVAAAEADCGT